MENKHKERNTWKGSRSESKVDHFLDLRGMIMPLTLLKIMQAFRNIRDGETMDIVGTDPDTRRDFLTVLGTSPCEVLWVRDEQDLYLIRLRKGRGKEV
jgi:TusA-related sulfurtransferase